jgi:hypothetical protein
MIYEYECECGKITEKICHVSDHTKTIRCSCGKRARQIFGQGSILRDNDVPWLPGVANVIQAAGERPIETRSGLKRYCREKGIECKG